MDNQIPGKQGFKYKDFTIESCIESMEDQDVPESLSLSFILISGSCGELSLINTIYYIQDNFQDFVIVYGDSATSEEIQIANNLSVLFNIQTKVQYSEYSNSSKKVISVGNSNTNKLTDSLLDTDYENGALVIITDPEIKMVLTGQNTGK